MKLYLYAAGRLDKTAFRDLQTDYTKKIRRTCSIEIQEVPEPGGKFNNPDEIIRRYSEALEKRIKDRPYILCDQKGRNFDSSGFARWLHNALSVPPGELVFVIGGSHGVSKTLRENARKVISFSPLTFPHQLFRIILLEQIYRAFSILHGTKYHK